MNTYDPNSNDFFVLKLKDTYNDSFIDLFLGWVSHDHYDFTRIFGATIFNEWSFHIHLPQLLLHYPVDEIFEKVPLVLLNMQKINEQKEKKNEKK